jgi:hypothetical protein
MANTGVCRYNPGAEQLLPTSKPQDAEERLDNSFVTIHRSLQRCICASLMTTSHPYLFNLESGYMGLVFFTTSRDVALSYS